MNASEIMKRVREDGFCVFNLPDALVHDIAKSNFEIFSDGFHVNNEQHLSIVNECPALEALKLEMYQECVERGYSFNQIHLVRSVESNSRERLRTHFDSHLYTIVLPSLLPETGGEDVGQLYMVPCKRPRPSNDVANIMSKAPALIYRGSMGAEILKKHKDYVQISLGIDEGIVFEGMRCLHGNRPNLTSEKRVTLISHYADPFPNGAGALMRSVRKFFGTRK